MTYGSALNHGKSLQIYFFYVMCQAKNNFLNDVESTVEAHQWSTSNKYLQQLRKTIKYQTQKILFRKIEFDHLLVTGE